MRVLSWHAPPGERPTGLPYPVRESICKTVGEGLAPPAVSRNFSLHPSGRSGTGPDGKTGEFPIFRRGGCPHPPAGPLSQT